MVLYELANQIWKEMKKPTSDNALVSVAGLAGHVAFDKFMTGIHLKCDGGIGFESPDFVAVAG